MRKNEPVTGSSASIPCTRIDGARLGPAFWTLVCEDLATHDRDWTCPGFRAMFMYRLGNDRFRHSVLVRKLLSFVYRRMHRYIRNHYGIELHASAQIGRRVKIAHQGGIVIHNNAVLGDDCVIRQCVTIGAVGGRNPDVAPRLGKAVNIGAGAVIIGGVSVGDNVRIGPNCVVMSSVPAGRTVVAPASRVL